AEFGVERDFAHVADTVGLDRKVGGGIAAHRGECAVLDAVAAHAHIAGAEYVDAIAVLARAAGAIEDRLDAVVDDEAAVVARLAAPDLDAVVTGAGDRVARDQEPARVERMDRDIDSVADRHAGDLAVNRTAVNCRSPGAGDRAIDDLDGAGALQMHEPAPFREPPPQAVEQEPRQRHVIGALRPKL